jgi:mannose-6-phosphate isomerase-like protein (cupin superfamily)
MKFKAWPVLIGVVLVTWAFAGEPPRPAVIQIDHEKVAAGFVKGAVLLDTNNFKIQAGHRDAPGLAEIHERDTDIFHVLEGTATLVTGGSAVEPNTVSPGEIRGKAITGGEERRLVKGDVIVIPNGVPHWFKETSSPFLYFVVKVGK